MKYILRLLFVVVFVMYAAPTFADFYWGVVDTYDVKVGNTFQVRRHTGSFTGWSRVRWEITDGMGAIEIVEQDQDRCTIKALYPIEYAKVTCYMYDYNVLNYEEHRINVTSDGQITITASPNGGNVIEGDKVSLSTNYSGTIIYYTLDGSTPTTDSQKYNSATGITITQNCTLKALAVKTNYTPGVLTAYYYISETFTEKTAEGVDLRFLITDKNVKTCEVASYPIGKKDSGSITIPKEARGYKVTGIQKSAFKDWYNITSITIPNTVTTIGEYAFLNCFSLLTVQIPNSVAQIGDCAFWACRSLKSVALSESITRLGDHMFDGCESLNSIVIPNSVQSIGQYAFNECSNLSSVVIPNSVTSIDKYAFMRCSSLKSVELPNSVTDIESLAFSSCSSLENITLSNSLKQFDFLIFYECPSIRTIKGGNNIEHLSNTGIFSSTPWAQNLPDGMNFLGKALYNYKGEMPANTILRIPEGCTEISVSFSGQNGLVELHIPSSVVSIKTSTRCPNLQKITVDASNTVYDSRNNCNAIINTATNTLIQGCCNTTIPTNVTSIGNSAFDGNWTKDEIIIPNQIDSIARYAFCYNSNVKSILIGKGLRKINEYAFYELPHLKEIAVSTSNPYYDSSDNCNAIIEKATKTLVVGCSTTIIPNTVKTIGNYAFWGNGDEDFTSLVIPNSVEEIKRAAFRGLPYLREVSIGANVKTFGNSIFYECNNLEAIESLNGFPDDIDENIFYSGEDFSIYDNVTLYVPAGCRNNYRLATGWSNFKNIVEGSLPVGVDDALTPQPKEEVIYSPTGVRLSAPQRGVNIVNGKKLLVK